MPNTKNAQDALTEIRSNMSQQLIPKEKNEKNVVDRPVAIDFKKNEKLKELILQDV